jgi:hypothetical protein
MFRNPSHITAHPQITAVNQGDILLPGKPAKTPCIQISWYGRNGFAPGMERANQDVNPQFLQCPGKLATFTAGNDWFIDVSVQVLNQIQKLSLAAGY